MNLGVAEACASETHPTEYHSSVFSEKWPKDAVQHLVSVNRLPSSDSVSQAEAPISVFLQAASLKQRKDSH